MEERRLLFIAILCSVAGILGLLFISESIKPISLNKAIKGERVSLNGRVIDNRDIGGRILINVIYDEKMSIIIEGHDNVDVKKGDRVEIIGQLDEYNGRKQIVAEELRIRK